MNNKEINQIELSYKEREEIFNKIITNIRNILYDTLNLDKHKKYIKNLNNEGYIPLLSFSQEQKKYRFNCYCFTCPANNKGLCSTEFFKIPMEALHEFDGDNIVKNYCG